MSNNHETSQQNSSSLNAQSQTHRSLSPDYEASKIFPLAPVMRDDEVESRQVWGFEDSGFTINDNGHATFIGSKYNLSGLELPSLVPWICDMMQITLDPKDIHTSQYPTAIPEAIRNEAFLEGLNSLLPEENISHDAPERLRHGHGHTQEEMYSIKYGRMKRVPDLVVYPTEEEHVQKLVAAAIQHDVVLIPFGGGTCVTEALMCPENEKRMIISVDMKRMNRILWIDPTNRMACIQAGAVGRHITRQLESYGFTMGHEPDSIEFSTLGGWIATNASGMKKNKYGNIEDIVLDVSVVTAQGDLRRSGVGPRESTGTDPRQWIFGSEGNLGIITKAIVKLFELPETKRFGSILFPSFEAGTAFMYELSKTGNPPASVRLVDNVQFQFSMALKPASKGLRVLKKRLEKAIVTKVKGFEPEKMVACTLVFEGREDEVAMQEKMVYRIASEFQGMKAGGENGQKGYELTFGIAYLRDWVMKHYILGESFETSVPWSQLLGLCQNVKERIHREHQALGFPGKAFVTCRVTQIYSTGACVYFYLGVSHKGVEAPTDKFKELETAARDEILRSGGSLSHHHGIGKLRQQFIPEIMNETMIQWHQGMKNAVDPQNVFGVGNIYGIDNAKVSQNA